ncbi:MAG: HAMP domain-containing sensor histidine kinase [Saprospiraceae bacterium]|nr:HAMP domain-containing sensor histidine kinase [Saprospiraceae bacterium]
MNINKTAWLIGASCLALILLVLFQVNWLRHSRKLIEEQFDQKVTMAICSAVESLGTAQNTGLTEEAACTKTQENCFASCLPANHSEPEMHDALVTALARYDINLDFKFDIVNNNFPELMPSTYCSKETPLTIDNQEVHVRFSNKERYIIQKMGFMISTSIFILLFISAMLLMTLIKFLRQKQLNEVSVEFFNNMAHEFRTPLTNMQLAINLFKKKQPEASDSKYLQILQSENKRLLEQIERMLHIAKLEKGEYQLEIEKIELQSLVQEVVADMKIQVAEKSGTIRIESNGIEQLHIQGDRLHLSNSIRNLIDNALKYCEQAPNITVKIEQNERSAFLSFLDNGIGICDQQKRLVFEKFRRGVHGNIHNQKGFGLGLAYVKRVVERHGGAIKLESEINNGSRFYVSLPLLLR